MQRIALNIGHRIDVAVRTSARARRMRLQAEPGVGIVAVVPMGASFEAVERFVRRHAAWADRMLAWLSRHADVTSLSRSRAEYIIRAPEAMRLVRGLVERLNAHYGFRVGRVGVRNQTSRWGSCGRKGDLSFNWKLVLIPPELAEYVVAHELCHIGSFDHSARFWRLVSETIPDWKARRAALKRYRL